MGAGPTTSATGPHPKEKHPRPWGAVRNRYQRRTRPCYELDHIRPEKAAN
jgi:hypothetical protein